MAHPVLFPASLLANKWLRKDPIRLFWWMDLVSLAAPVDGCTVRIGEGKQIECQKGMVITTRGLLSKRWGVSRDAVKNFLVSACRENLVKVVSHSTYSQLSIVGYDDYVPSEPSDASSFTQQITHPKKPASSCKSGGCDCMADTELPTFLPTSTDFTHEITHPNTDANACKSECYDDTPSVILPTQLPTSNKNAQQTTHPKKSASSCKSDGYGKDKHGVLPTFLPTSGEKQEMKETENETENASPTPPIKEKDKEKESKEPLTRGRGFNSVETTFSVHTRDGELELAKLQKAEERKAKAEEKKHKQKALVTKGREVFEAFFKEQYGECYYWEAKDSVAMKRVFQKITFRRLQRKPPLPVDDDSLVDAFAQFLHSINKAWIANNFSMTKIDSQYNDIISEIQNQKKNARYTSDSKSAGQSRLEGQAVAILNDIAKADELYYRNRQESQRTPQPV